MSSGNADANREERTLRSVRDLVIRRLIQNGVSRGQLDDARQEVALRFLWILRRGPVRDIEGLAVGIARLVALELLRRRSLTRTRLQEGARLEQVPEGVSAAVGREWLLAREELARWLALHTALTRLAIELALLMHVEDMTLAESAKCLAIEECKARQLQEQVRRAFGRIRVNSRVKKSPLL